MDHSLWFTNYRQVGNERLSISPGNMESVRIWPSKKPPELIKSRLSQGWGIWYFDSEFPNIWTDSINRTSLVITLKKLKIKLKIFVLDLLRWFMNSSIRVHIQENVNIKWSASSRWPSSLYCPLRNSDEMTTEDAPHCTIIVLELVQLMLTILKCSCLRTEKNTAMVYFYRN